MNSFFYLLREIRDCFRFFCKIRKGDKEIVFYAEHEGYYPYFEGLVDKITNGNGRSLCYVTSDPRDPVLQKASFGIKALYLNKLLPFFMVFVNCKVFVITLTDLNQFHLKRSVYPVHYVYIFHSPVSTHMMFRYGAYDHYDCILCVGPHHTREIRRHEELNNLPAKILLDAGYYRLERVYAAYKKYSCAKNTDNSKKTVLIAPSWGNKNVLESCGSDLTSILLNAGYEVIVRPHPETMRYSPGLINSLISKFSGNPNFTLENSISTDQSLLKADVLICDCSGIALEYAFGTERPVLFLSVPLKIRNKRFKELGIMPLELSIRSKIGVILSPDKIGTVPDVISKLIANQASYKERLSKMREQNIYSFGRSSDVGAKYILDYVKKREGM